MPRDCPECGAAMDGLSCRGCGFTSAPTRGETPRDPLWGRCEHMDRGMRCGKPGSVSRDTSGPSAESKWSHRWFCFDHAFPKSVSTKREPPPRGTVIAGHFRRVADVAPQRQPGEDG